MTKKTRTTAQAKPTPKPAKPVGVDLGALQKEFEAARKSRASAKRAYQRAGDNLDDANRRFEAAESALNEGMTAVTRG